MISKQQYSWIILYSILFGLYCRGAYISLVIPDNASLSIFSYILLGGYWIITLLVALFIATILIDLILAHMKYFLYHADTVTYKEYFNKLLKDFKNGK